MQKNFMGKSGFTWFVGVVEDRNDPKFLGRVRVRCLGLHTEDTSKLPTADLPWAHPMNPITSATISGVGQTPLGPVEGTNLKVFVDAISHQYLDGATVEYTKTLMAEQFQIRNPSASSSCGCGSSFAV